MVPGPACNLALLKMQTKGFIKTAKSICSKGEKTSLKQEDMTFIYLGE